MSSVEEVKQAAVRLEGSGSLRGTGFFVGPGLVVTCAHVVGDLTEVEIVCGGAAHPGRVLRRETADQTGFGTDAILFPDIALISVAGLEGAPVELDETFGPGDRLWVWGFPEEAPDGDCLDGECEGDRNFGGRETQRLIKLKQTQITRNFSGSPVLNRRTHKVCGMLKRTRDEHSPAGGYAIRAGALLALPEVEENQRRLETPLKKALRAYLGSLAEECSKLPGYFPLPLQSGFDQIRQRVRVIADRERFYQLAEQRERRRAAGDWREEYYPMRARPEERSLGYERLEYSPAEERIEIREWDEIRLDERRRKLVVLGDPGFGKSWLLRYEALRRVRGCQEEFDRARPRELTVPVLVKLQDLARHVTKRQTLAQTLDLALEAAGVDAAVRPYFAEQLERGRVALLLDAWDEVAEDRERQALLQQLQVWGRTYPGTVRLTSRPARFGLSPLGDAPVVELLAFERTEIETFTRTWFAESAAADFLAELERHSAVNGLARIPLMLSLLCRVFESRAMRLPLRRVQLHEECLKGLLLEWKLEDKRAEPRAVNEVTLEAAIERLSRAALALYPNSQFTRLALAKELRFADLADANPFIQGMIGDGLLVPAGSKQDGPLMFLHRTFHEYLAAWQWKAEEWSEAKLDERSWDVMWHPVITLLAGLLPLEGSMRLCRHLADPKTDDLFRPRLALAVLCLRETAEDQRDGTVVDRVTGEVFDLWIEHFRREANGALVRVQETLPALVELGGRYRGQPVREWLAMVWPSELFLALVEAVGAAAASWEALVRLLEFIRASEGIATWLALDVLKRLGEKAATPEVLGRILELSRDAEWAVRRNAAYALGSLGDKAATPEVLGRLLELSRDPEVLVRASGAESLGRFGERAATPEVVARFLELTRAPAASVRASAAESLGRLGEKAATPEVVGRLLELSLDPEAGVRGSAAEALGRLGEKAATSGIVRRLLELSRDSSVYVCESVALALGRLGEKAAARGVLGWVVELSRHPDEYVRGSAAEVLGRLGETAATPDVLARLLELSREPEEYVRWCSAEGLGSLREKAATREVLGRLLELTRDPKGAVRRSAAYALGRLGEKAATPEVLERLVELIRDPKKYVRSDAAYALGALQGAAPDVRIPRPLGRKRHNLRSRARAASASDVPTV